MIKLLVACLLAVSFSANTPASPNIPSIKEYNCLVRNIYYEAKGQPKSGKEAVGLVTMNRLRDHRYPNTICKVVYQPGQFSWTADNTISKKINSKEWRLAMNAATAAYNSVNHFRATHFHNDQVRPYWTKRAKIIAIIGNHTFYTV